MRTPRRRRADQSGSEYRRTPSACLDGLLESVCQLQHAEVGMVAADDLNTHREALCREASRRRYGRVAGERDIPAGFHPVDVALHPDAVYLGRIRKIHVERGRLGSGKDEILASLQKRLEASPKLAVERLGTGDFRAAEPQAVLDLASQCLLVRPAVGRETLAMIPGGAQARSVLKA